MSNEIKVGDKVRVREDAPNLHPLGWDAVLKMNDSVVLEIEGDTVWVKLAIAFVVDNKFPIPTKYLVKVEEEKKGSKFKVGDRVRVKGCGYEPNLHKGDIGEILDINDKGQCFVLFKKSQAWIYADCLESFTEPTEEVNLQDATREFVETHPFDIESLKRGRKVFEDMFWEAYTADLAKEIVLKTVNSALDRRPSAIAEYATDVAKSVAEGLKRE